MRAHTKKERVCFGVQREGLWASFTVPKKKKKTNSGLVLLSLACYGLDFFLNTEI